MREVDGRKKESDIMEHGTVEHKKAPLSLQK